MSKDNVMQFGMQHYTIAIARLSLCEETRRNVCHSSIAICNDFVTSPNAKPLDIISRLRAHAISR